MAKESRVIGGKDVQLSVHNDDKTLVYKKGGAVFAFNFHPTYSQYGFEAIVPEAGTYDVVLSTDDHCYGGFARVSHQTYETEQRPDGKHIIRLYLPSRTAIVLRKV